MQTPHYTSVSPETEETLKDLYLQSRLRPFGEVEPEMVSSREYERRMDNSKYGLECDLRNWVHSPQKKHTLKDFGCFPLQKKKFAVTFRGRDFFLVAADLKQAKLYLEKVIGFEITESNHLREVYEP